MRVVTTCNKTGLELYGHRWLKGMANWPAGAEFHWYTEGYEAPKGVIATDFAELPAFTQWKLKHAGYEPPSWQWNVVGYAHKVFAAADALYDYDGIGVWLDADVVTYKKIPEALMATLLDGHYLARFERTGMYTETGMWIVDCRHPEHRNFLDAWRNVYFSERYKVLPQWHDCMTMDATVRTFLSDGRITTTNLSGEHCKAPHPMAVTEIGKYLDHCKGPRKIKGRSPENKFRKGGK